ncbi:MAG: MCE family protein [Gammaproteobacteria bacterium]|nr:MCE family protein [Gammaproteobacteria bacterium]
MTDTTSRSDVPRATVSRRKRMHVSVVWVIPLLAALVALGVAVQRLLAEGPSVDIVFSNGNGIEAGKTLIKYKDVNIGQVTSVRLIDKFSRVRVTARVAKSAAGLMVEGTKFWVVAPHIGLTGVSGISTLLSGNYIGVQPGHSARAAREFVGLDEQPRITDEAGRRFRLTSATLGSLDVGSPVYYRSLRVGQIESHHLANDGQSFDIGVFIAEPYVRLIRAQTRFWNAGGIDVSIGENGVDIRTASLLALLAGGVSFDTPDFGIGSPAASEGAAFELHSNRVSAMKAPEPFSRHFVLSFNEPVRGLNVGAPVTLMGLPVGEVTRIGFTYDPKTLEVHPLVHFNFYPEEAITRFPAEQQPAVRSHTESDVQKQMVMLRKLVEERGLRAQLRTSSLLTGQRYISFEFEPRATKVRVDWSQDPLQLPVAPGQIPDMEAKLSSILAKIDSMPLAEIGQRTSSALKTLNQTLSDAGALLRHVDVSTVPELKKTLADLDKVLDGANATLVDRDAPGQQALREALAEVANAARSLRALTDYLERHPEALIRGKVTESK